MAALRQIPRLPTLAASSLARYCASVSGSSITGRLCPTRPASPRDGKVTSRVHYWNCERAYPDLGRKE